LAVSAWPEPLSATLAEPSADRTEPPRLWRSASHKRSPSAGFGYPIPSQNGSHFWDFGSQWERRKGSRATSSPPAGGSYRFAPDPISDLARNKKEKKAGAECSRPAGTSNPSRVGLPLAGNGPLKGACLWRAPRLAFKVLRPHRTLCRRVVPGGRQAEITTRAVSAFPLRISRLGIEH
jgi:hypothetical protein